MTDFESVTVPNSDDDSSSVDSCEDITIPDTPDPYGGKDCPCDCHNSSTDNRMLNKSRHCVKCGVKFIDGRIYIQTGKVLKPAQVTYHDAPSSSADKDKVNGHPVVPKPQMPLDTAPKSTPTLEVNGKSDLCNTISRKDTSKPNSAQKPVLTHDEKHVLSNNRLPCDVIEDTVFPAITNTLNKSTPSDFSHLKEMIAPATVEESNDKTSSSAHNMKWTRDDDRLIIYNCQRYGISRKAFATSAAAIKSRTAEEVEERFLNLMKMLSEEMKKQ